MRMCPLKDRPFCLTPMRGGIRPGQWIGLLSLVLATTALAGCSSSPTPVGVSREALSENYCLQAAHYGSAAYDPSLRLACRREEYTAAARARTLELPSAIDRTCAATAAHGAPDRFFSWTTYMLCVDRLAPASL